MISIVAAVTNGVFWACVLGAVWLPFAAFTKEAADRSINRKLLAAIVLVVGVGVWVLARGLIKSAGEIAASAAYQPWLVGFAVATIAMGAVACLTPTYQPDGRRNQGLDHLQAKLVLPSVFVAVFAIPLGLAYHFDAIRSTKPKPVATEAGPQKPKSDGAYSDTMVMAMAQQAVKEKLVDPGSAKFRKVFVVQQPSGTKAVCGEVNSKNRMGGYSGFEGFISSGLVEHTWLASEMADFPGTWNALCVRKPQASLGKATSSSGGVTIPVPSDPAATYTLMSTAKKGANRVEIVSRRNGPSGESFSRRLVNCSNLTSRYTGDGRTMEEMEASSSDQTMSSWEAGAISKEVSRFACRRAQ